IDFKFFFQRNALPGNEDIFKQKGGEIFDIPETPYIGEDVIYQESAPQPPDPFPPPGEPIEYV
ncbi:MAG TPA: hypothetical protein DF383_10875, partial [Deltaproteobacteria bacterium]|nr:hypothetical protein [Deltaproteobacteria bacterium]